MRIIASFSVGYEHFDLPALRRRGIVATNTPDVLTEATADVAMLCLLGAARRAWESQLLLRRAPLGAARRWPSCWAWSCAVGCWGWSAWGGSGRHWHGARVASG